MTKSSLFNLGLKIAYSHLRALVQRHREKKATLAPSRKIRHFDFLYVKRAVTLIEPEPLEFQMHLHRTPFDQTCRAEIINKVFGRVHPFLRKIQIFPVFHFSETRYMQNRRDLHDKPHR